MFRSSLFQSLMKLHEDINEQSFLNPELINYLPFLYSHQFVLFVCFFHLAPPFISPPRFVSSTDGCRSEFPSSFGCSFIFGAFECYLAYCQRDSRKTKKLETQDDRFTLLLDVHWKRREYRSFAFMSAGKIVVVMSLLR